MLLKKLGKYEILQWLGGGRFGDVEMDDFPSSVTKDKEDIEHPKGCCGNCEKVDGSNVLGVIGQKGSPALGRGLGMPYHVLRHRSLADFDTKFKELAMDSGCSPQRIPLGHGADQLSNLTRYPWPTRPTNSAFPSPVIPESLSVPADDRFWLDDVE